MDVEKYLELTPDVRLVKYYLKRELSGKLPSELIPEVDIYKYAPWDLPQMAGWKGAQSRWYFFCPRSKKYNGSGGMNRRTDIGFWKATGKDKQVHCNDEVVGEMKTLVFYTGRAPSGQRTDWGMHEYRIAEKELAGCEVARGEYVLCRIFKKNSGPGPKICTQRDETSSQKEGIGFGYPFPPDFLAPFMSDDRSVLPTSAISGDPFMSSKTNAMSSALEIRDPFLMECENLWPLPFERKALWPFERLLPYGATSYRDGNEKNEITMNQEPSVLVSSSSRWKKLAICVRFNFHQPAKKLQRHSLHQPAIRLHRHRSTELTAGYQQVSARFRYVERT